MLRSLWAPSAIAAVVALATIGGAAALVLASPETRPMQEQVLPAPDPAFFAWDGTDSDGLNRYPVAIEAAGGDGLLSIENGRLVRNPNAGDAVASPDDLAAAPEGLPPSAGTDAAMIAIAAHPGVTRVDMLGPKLLAVAGSIDAAALAGLPGVTRVDLDVKLRTASADGALSTPMGPREHRDRAVGLDRRGRCQRSRGVAPHQG